MGKCIVFCAAGFDGLIAPIAPDDYILAADGGLAHVQALGLEPDGILGDFDSLGYTPTGAQVFPVEKDDTDSMLAARQALAMGFRQLVIYGGLEGDRLDHTVANYQMLQFLADHGATGYLVGRHQVATVVKDGAITFPASAQGTVSVFCMGRDAEGVTLENLYYPLHNATLSAGFPLGVSNHFTGKPGKISVASGSLLVFWDRRNGLVW